MLNLALTLSFLLCVFLGACQGRRGSPEVSSTSASADSVGRQLEYSSQPLASVNSKGQLELPEWQWSGRLSRGSAHYEVLPVE